LQRFKEIYERLVSSFLLLCRILIQLFKERKMRGPIIEEHLTNGTIPNGGAANYYVKSDGRLLRAYAKYTATATTSTVTFQVRQVAHFSDSVGVVAFPNNSAGNTDGIITPDGGLASSNSAASHIKSVLVCDDGAVSEYVITITNNSGANITGVYVISELV
jgi:hypothetical protein